MSLAQTYRDEALVLSFELFPPKTEAGMKALATHLERLLAFHPHFITCTYGAGGSSRENTLSTLRLVRELCDVPVASHLTCVDSPVEELRAYLRKAAAQGIDHIVALRGDQTEDDGGFRAADGGLTYADELVALIRSEFPHFGVAVGGYPEKHPEAPSFEADLENLKRKVDCGADVVITQLYYDNALFFRFRDRCAAIGIDAPVVPGILPVTNYKQVKRITSLCGATMPEPFTRDLERQGEDPKGQFAVGVDYATKQVRELVEAGVPGVHFYVLNRSQATAAVLGAVDLPRPQ